MKRLIGLGITLVGAATIYEYLRRKGVVDQLKGEAKRLMGNMTDDNMLKTEGMMDTIKGKTLQAVDEVKHVTHDVVEDVKETFADPKSSH
jgi:uncharacterized protein YjbJ (UPF0337 family)